MAGVTVGTKAFAAVHDPDALGRLLARWFAYRVVGREDGLLEVPVGFIQLLRGKLRWLRFRLGAISRRDA
jgi:hypothetical protein